LTQSRLFCDIGNTHFYFYDGEDSYKVKAEGFDRSTVQSEVYYISVNDYWEKELADEKNWINLRTWVDFDKYYESMGIDRIACCEAVEDALIIDAGSAITVDKVKNGQHLGGYIYPGFNAMAKCFKDISPRLEVSFNFDIDLATMPKNTRDALSYGAISPLISQIREDSDTKAVIITGGDAERLLPFIPGALIDHELVFKGMKKMLQGKA
jgi:type III pantothenate kinase